MKVVCTIVLLMMISTLGECVNPGFVAGIKLPIIERVKAKYFNQIMEKLRSIKIDDVETSEAKISNITIEVINESMKNIDIAFNETANGISLDIDKTMIKGKVNWKYSKSIIKLSGVGDITAPINHFGILLGFDTQKKGNFIIPKVNIQDFDIEFDVSKFEFKFDCNACPSTVINFLISLIKGPVLNKIRSEAQKIVKTKVVDIINEKLLEHYPTTIPVGESMSMGLATTGPIKVKSTYLKAPIDGTFFKTSEGYNRPSEPDIIPSENPINPGEILLFTSPHILNTLSKTIAKIPISIHQVIKGYNITIDFDARNYPFKLYTEFDNIVVKGAVNITVPSLDLKLEIGGRSELGLFFRPGDKNNTIYLDPDIDEYSLKFDLFRVYIKGVRVNFNWATGLANYIIGIILNNKTIPKIPIEKSPILPLTATAAVLRLFDTYSEIGVKFDFNLFNE